MNLTPREKDKLLIAMAANVARRRLERGVKLNHPEAIALITDFVVEGARDGRFGRRPHAGRRPMCCAARGDGGHRRTSSTRSKSKRPSPMAPSSSPSMRPSAESLSLPTLRVGRCPEGAEGHGASCEAHEPSGPAGHLPNCVGRNAHKENRPMIPG